MKIFISYRRDDSRGDTNYLYHLLCEHFSPDDIFRDISAIQPGEDFVEVIENAVAECKVLLAVIGKHWLNIADENGNRRLDNPNDFVRIEIATALARNIRVIPLLVGRAGMPTANNLPDDLQKLSRRNALELSDKNFKQDVGELVAVLERVLKSPTSDVEPAVSSPKNFPSSQILERRFLPLTILLPQPFAACEIPAGKVKLEKGGYIPEGGKIFEVQPFTIAKYPITNAQFQAFIGAKNGYNDAKWWDYSADAKIWRRNNPLQEIGISVDDYPRTNVTWFEAVAFCQWLSDATGVKISLPTEQQWQRAAQGDDGRVYPWGNKFEKNRCNSLESNIHQSTLVNKYEGRGDSPFGVVDMSGNACEWCLTDYEKGSNDVNETVTDRVLRGGSFHYRHIDARVAARFIAAPHNRSEYMGFRIVWNTSP